MKEHDQSTQAVLRHRPAPVELVRLYDRAFQLYGARALWNLRRLKDPTVEQALAITRQLRTEGNMDARRLAEEIEEVARADL